VDFLVIDHHTDEEESHLVAAAVNKTLLESFESCLKRGGITPQTVVPGGSSTAEYLTKIDQTVSDYIILDLEKESSTLFLIQSGQISSIRSFKTGPDRGKSAAMNINRTVLAFSEQKEQTYQPEMLFVTGAGLSTPGTRETLTQITGLPLESVEFLESMDFLLDERVRDLWESDLYSNALSLCYEGLYGAKGLKLTERYVALGKYVSEYRDKIIRRAVLLGLVLVLLLFNAVFDTVTMSRKITRYNQQMKDIYKQVFPNATKIVDPYNELKAKVAQERKKSSFADSNAGNVRVIDLLNDISKSVQDSLNVEFERLVLGSDDLKISGTADTYSTVDTMKNQLEKIDYFKSVAITSTTGEQNDKLVHFKLSINFKGQQ
jgi:hypothetical protein